VPSSDFDWSSLLAVVALGALGTGVAFYWFASLIGSVGATRGSVTIYFVPVVAIVLGATLRDEPVHAAALAGTALVLAGAYLTSRPKPS
jgi:drug/metabolite transporter (DMT)-like permease